MSILGNVFQIPKGVKLLVSIIKKDLSKNSKILNFDKAGWWVNCNLLHYRPHFPAFLFLFFFLFN